MSDNYYINSENRSSDDALESKHSKGGIDTRDYVRGLLDSEGITIKDVLVFFNYACGAYKQASRTIGSSDAKINIEFNYAARAFASYMDASSDDKAKKLALLDAFQASRHIINDSLDLVLGEVERHLIMSLDISRNFTISEYIENFDKHFDNKENIYAVVAESRRKRGLFRYQEYLRIINEGSYEDLILFLSKLKKAIYKLGQSAKEETKRSQRDILMIILGLGLTLLIGLFPVRFAKIGDYIFSNEQIPAKESQNLKSPPH